MTAGIDQSELSQERALIVGISGPSSSGKTTLARLLQRIFCGVRIGSSPSNGNSNGAEEDEAIDTKLNTFIIHEDDFYYPDDRIPYTKTPSGKIVQDWDTSAAIDTSFLAQALSYVRTHGHLPPRLRSKEDQNENTGPCVPDSLVTQLRRDVETRINDAIIQSNQTQNGGKQNGTYPTLVFMEGFLLYAPPEPERYGNQNEDGDKRKNNERSNVNVEKEQDGNTPQGAHPAPAAAGDDANPSVNDEYYPTDHSVLRPVHAQIGLPLFLPAAYSTVKSRREGRSGYVTIGPAPEPPATGMMSNTTASTTKDSTATTDSNQPDKNETNQGKESEEINLEEEDDRPPQNFWVDPPGYVDDIVWPRYVRDHAWLLVGCEDEDETKAEGDENKNGNSKKKDDIVERVGEGVDVREDVGIRVAPGKGAVGMEIVLRWAVDEVLRFYIGAR